MAEQQMAIELRQIVKRFGAFCAVDAVSLAVAPGELLALLGPSGCGKSTTLRLLAGLEQPDGGEIWLGGRMVAGPGVWVPPEQRQVGLVFQDGALFPHLTVAENIAFPLGRDRQAARQRVAELSSLVGLAGLEGRYPHQLSGGQQQRVALARALAPNPAVVLLDEPFANLDAALRQVLREEVAQIVRRAGTTTVLVTHDQEEALSLADRVAVMFDGQLVQVATPQLVYAQPATRGVAMFVGAANLLPASAHGFAATCALGRLALLAPCEGPVELLVRPEALELTVDPLGLARVERVIFYGHDQMVHLVLPDGTRLQAQTAPRGDLAPGVHVRLALHQPVLAYPAPGLVTHEPQLVLAH